jgi:hypothetical protein
MSLLSSFISACFASSNINVTLTTYTTQQHQYNGTESLSSDYIIIIATATTTAAAATPTTTAATTTTPPPPTQPSSSLEYGYFHFMQKSE